MSYNPRYRLVDNKRWEVVPPTKEEKKEMAYEAAQAARAAMKGGYWDEHLSIDIYPSPDGVIIQVHINP